MSPDKDKKEDQFDATNPETHHQSKLMSFILSDKEATVQTLFCEGKESERKTVRHYDSTITYDTFVLKGIEAKLNIELYETIPEKLQKMEQAEDPESGKKKYTKDDVKKFIRAYCFNKCKATRDVLATREDFMAMSQFVESILFDEEHNLRDKPPKGITQSKSISKYYVWETKKFMVKVSTEAYIQLESTVRKFKQKAKKEDSLNIVAETKKVTFLQKNMRILPGEYCSGAEFAAYFKEIFKEMYPSEFGSEKGLKKEADGIKPKENEKPNPLEEGEESEEETPEEDESEKPKKKKGSSKKK